MLKTLSCIFRFHIICAHLLCEEDMNSFVQRLILRTWPNAYKLWSSFMETFTTIRLIHYWFVVGSALYSEWVCEWMSETNGLPAHPLDWPTDHPIDRPPTCSTNRVGVCVSEWVSEKQTGPQRVHSSTHMYIMRTYFLLLCWCLFIYSLYLFINLFNYLFLFSSWSWVFLGETCPHLQ